jgi:hypothetical protein
MAPSAVSTPISEPYWEGLAQERLLIQRCDACQSWVFYPRIRCTTCLSDQLRWQEVEPRGVLYTFSIAHHPTAPWFPADPPQIVAVVELANGVRMTTNVITDGPESLSIGMAVTGVFEHRGDVTLLKFRRADDDARST